MEDHGRRMTMNEFRLKILHVEINIVYLELPLNVPVDTNLCFSVSPAATALGKDFYAKAYRHPVLGNLTQVVFSSYLC